MNVNENSYVNWWCEKVKLIQLLFFLLSYMVCKWLSISLFIFENGNILSFPCGIISWRLTLENPTMETQWDCPLSSSIQAWSHLLLSSVQGRTRVCFIWFNNQEFYNFRRKNRNSNTQKESSFWDAFVILFRF